MGDDVRWVGNESGIGRPTEWSATVLAPGIYGRSAGINKSLKINNNSKDLGGRDMLAKANELFWYPSEVDVSIRPGWFYHDHEDDKVKSLSHLMNIYFESVGYNSVLLLNIPPDKRGRIHENDSTRLMEFASYIDKTFSNNLVKKGNKLWKANAGNSKEYALTSKAPINVVVLQEDISKGQRVEKFTIEALVDGTWKEIGNGTTVGYKRMVRLPQVTTNKLRVTINNSRLTSNISNVAADYAEPSAAQKVQTVWNNQPRNHLKVTITVHLTI